MQNFLIGSFILFSTFSCTTSSGVSSSERLEMTGLEDMSLDYIKTKWGEPETNIAKGEGRILHFKKIRSEDENPISQKVSVKYCDVKLELNQENLVKTWAYENCKALESKK